MANEITDYFWWALPEVAAEHDDMNRTYFERGNVGQYPYFDTLAKALKLIDQKDMKTSMLSCLDIGCGAGWQAVYMSSLGLDVRFIYEGMDISSHMCERAKRNYPSGDFHVADIMDFHPEKLWDVVMACGSIEHFVDWKSFLSRMVELSSDWIVIHKVFFHDANDKPTEMIICPTYAGRTQPRMVMDYAEFTKTLSDLGCFIEQRFDWDSRAVSCVVARKCL